MAIRSTGPVDRDQYGGSTDNWHLEAFNPNTFTVGVRLTAFNLDTSPASEIGSVSIQLAPQSHQYFTVDTNGIEHTMAQVSHPLGRDGILVTIYGRHGELQIPGAVYRHTQLIDLA